MTLREASEMFGLMLGAELAVSSRPAGMHGMIAPASLINSAEQVAIGHFRELEQYEWASLEIEDGRRG